MVGEYTEITFAQLVGGRENVIGGPFGSNLVSADYTTHGVPVIRGSNMSQAGRFVGGEFAYVSEPKAAALSANQIDAGDLVVTQRGTLGQVSITPIGPYPKYIVSQSQMGVKVRGADRLFVYYLLTSPLFSQFIDGAAIQAGVPHINLGLLREWRVSVPSLREQKEIARLLGALDERIELNERMAKALQTLAHAIFRSWFIDFGPVRAKAEGRETNLPPDTAALFGSAFGDHDLPNGWSRRTLGELF